MAVPQIVSLATLIFAGVFGALMLYVTYTLFAWTPLMVTKARDALGYPRWFWLLAGVVALIGALGLFAGLALPEVAAVAALWMVAYFVVAILAHLVRGDWANVGFPFVFLLFAVGLTALQWGEVAALPRYVGL